MRKVTMLAVLAALAAAGCGGGGGSGGIANFVGDWDYSAGSISQTCQGAVPTATSLVGYSVFISRTSNPGEIEFVSNFDQCARYLTVSGNTATMRSYDPLCGDRAVDANGDAYTLSITPLTEVLTYRGGRVMNESATNSLRYLYDDNTYIDCTSTVSNASLF
jgi:hypothetical protein